MLDLLADPHLTNEDAGKINLGSALALGILLKSCGERAGLAKAENLEMCASKRAPWIVLATVICLAAAGDLAAQSCQGCTCAGSTEVHSVLTLGDCIKGCSVVQLVCTGRDIMPNTTVFGLGFSVGPKDIPTGCTVRAIPNGGLLTGRPASGCAKANEGK